MSLRKLQIKEAEIKEAILDVLAYFAVMNLRLDFDSLYSYLPVRASHLAVKKQLRGPLGTAEKYMKLHLFATKSLRNLHGSRV